ncbi:MAG: glycosyltransferase [Pseudomonadota bacterium]
MSAVRFAYATLVSSPDYVLGATALARSLHAVESKAPLLALCTDTAFDVADLERAGAQPLHVAPPALSDEFRQRHSRKAIHAAAPFTKGNKPAFHDPLNNFAKLCLWQLTDCERIVFLDADTLVIKNIDRLFGYPEFSAAPNLYESLDDMHRLNSGVFVAEPSTATYERMLAVLDAPDAYWRRTDQTFLETFFPAWHGLPYTFNALQYVYFNLPALWRWDSINVVHYQYEKPWQADNPKADLLRDLIGLWHQVLETGEIPALPQRP